MSAEVPDDDPVAYIRRVQAEIEADAELRRRRDPTLRRLERDIERAWAAVAPPGAVGPADELLLDRVERLAMVDVDAPVGSRPGASQLKRAVRKLTYWYVRYLADQLNALHNVLVRLLRRLDERVDAIEQSLDLSAARPGLVDPVPEPSLAVARAIAAAVAGTDGMVAVVSCGAGGVVGALSAAGVGAYGVDGDPTVIAEGVHEGLDLRPADPVEHLRSVEDAALAGVVLAGVVEDLGLGACVGVVDEAVRVVGPGGVVVVAVAEPADRGTVETELRRGRGLSPETWAHLLGRAGCESTIDTAHGERIRRIVVARRP